jgi:hypothetical protein
MATLGVTIGVGEDHQFYAEEAASRVRRHLGLETFIIGDEHLHHALNIPTSYLRPRTLKFAIFDIIPEHWDRVMYFDADWRPVRDWNVDELFPDPDAIYVAPDNSHKEQIQKLEVEYGLPPGAYFNAGWMILPRSSKPLIEEAKRQYPVLPKTFPDQCTFNQVMAGKVTLVSQAFNVIDLTIWPDVANVMGLHTTIGKWNYKVYRGDVPDRDWSVTPYPDPAETIIRNLDYSRPSTASADHLVEVYHSAAGYAGGTALDLGSLRGHSTLALALAGLRVRSYGSGEKFRPARTNLLARHHMTVDHRLAEASDELALPDTFDVVMHHTGYSNLTPPELDALWQRKLNPGGLLIIHGAGRMEADRLLADLSPIDHTSSSDERNVRIDFYRKALGS